MAAVIAAFSSIARADFPSVNARSFQPPTDPQGSLYLEPTQTPGPGAFNMAGWVAYAFRPAVLRDGSGNIVAHLVSHQLSADLTGNLGLGQRFALGFDLPFVLYQQGDDNALTRAAAGGKVPAQAFGDLAFVGKANLVAPASLGGFGLSTLLRVSVPTGDTNSYLSDGTSTGELRALAEYKIIAVSLQATGGFRLRFDDTDVLTRTYENSLPWGAALSVRPQAFGWDDKGRWTWIAEVHGAVFLPPPSAAQDRGQKTPGSPVLAGLSARFALKDVSFLLGAEAGLSQALGNPPFQVVASAGWAPRVHDMDHDGVPDDVDQCPELPEDRDGFQDADGCPDWDNDDDGVGDATDRCPNEKEDVDGFQDEDGCPDPDNDQDGILDKDDACPNQAGERRDDPKTNGCPDSDHDGVIDKRDKCPREPEDRDGFQDADGCPDLDNDKDGVPDAEDVCPNVAQGPSTDPQRPGCPAPDRDGDTFADEVDQCPDQAEVWNGIEDEDGCPDQGGKPLVVIDERHHDISVKFAQSIKWKGPHEEPALDPVSIPTLRALSSELYHHPTWIVAVGVRPENPGAAAQEVALARALVVAEALRKFSYRDGVAETVGWKAVAKQPGAATSGFGVLVLAPPEKPAIKKGP